MDQEAINDNVLTILETLKQEKIQRKIQAKETKRRLKQLNGEGNRIKEILKESIPREVFDRTMQARDEKYDATTKELMSKIEILTAWKITVEGSDMGRDKKGSGITSIWLMVFAIVTVLGTLAGILNMIINLSKK